MTEETTDRMQNRKVAIIAFPGITRDEAESIAAALKKDVDRMGIAVYVTNVAVEAMSKKEFVDAVRSIKDDLEARKS